jgi:competence protein ComEC
MLQITKSKLLFYSCLSFVLGIFIAGFASENFFISRIYVFGTASLFFILSILSYKKTQNLKSWHFFIFLMFFSLAFWRYSLSTNLNEINFVNIHHEQNISLKGKIINEPVRTNKNQSFIFKVEPEKMNRKIMIYADLYPEFQYGDYLEISGLLKMPEEFNGFDFKRYLERFGVYSLLFYPEINIIDRKQGNKFKSLIYNFKNKIRFTFDRNLDMQSSILAKACFLGDKKDIPDNLRDSFAKSGLSHIMAISGLHISIIILIFMNLNLSLGIKRQTSLILTIFLLIFYLVLIAMPASAIRASIMGIIALFALNSGRTKNFLRILVLAGVFMLIFNPRLLRDDLGFQLSFLSVLGIILFFPLVNNFFLKLIHKKFQENIFLNSFFSIISITISAQIFIWPLLVQNFSQISLIAPISNLFVLWTLPFLIIFLISALILSFIFYGLSLSFFVFPKIILSYIVFIADFFSKYPIFYKEIYYVSPLFLFVYFCLIFLIIYLNDT